MFLQFSKDQTDPFEYMRLGRRFPSAPPPNIRVLLHATATEIKTDPTGSKLDSVELRSPEGKRTVVKPKVLVLCAGGIDHAGYCSGRTESQKKASGTVMICLVAF
jgi:hypothetical protein